MKKFFIISSVFLGVFLIFWGIYNLSFKSGSSSDTSPQETVPNQNEEVVPPKKEEAPLKVKKISDEAVVAPVLSQDGTKIMFYAAVDGRVFSVSLEGTAKNTISSQALSGLTGVLWSPDRQKVISEFEGEKKRYMYDYTTLKGTQLKDNIAEIAWSNLGDRIFYQYSSGKINELDTADPDGSNWKKVTEILHPLVKIAPVPQTSLVTFWTQPKAAEETTLISVGILGGDAKKIFSGKFGADYLWSVDGKKGLVSSSDAQGSNKINLGVIKNDGTGFQSLNIPTWVSKCVWSRDGKTIYYALPGDVPETAVLPDDYQSKKISTKDTFWKVNIETGEKSRLIELADLNQIGVGFDAGNLFLDQSETYLFFVNRTDGKIYRIDL